MNEPLHPRLRWLGALRASPDVILAAGILSILFVILVPLPPLVVDGLLILNLTLSVVVLLTAACVQRPLDFSVFPSLLLVTTFFRLALNIATTRLILGNAVDGPLAAGRVVLTFGEFVAADNPVIGLIIFTVMVVVQFVVITKGATRVSEVAARFQLDAMPGKQLGIDADLTAGLIDQKTAGERRREVSSEADFYGAMDGASKFVRGDAVAGIIVVFINIVGGIAVGTIYHGMGLADAVQVFSRLTIGDGLVSQIPALMVSIAAARLVTRSADSDHLGRDLGRQVLSNDQVLFVVGAFLLFLVPSGLPSLPLLLGAVACLACGVYLRRERGREGSPGKPALEPLDSPDPQPSRSERTTPADIRSLLPLRPVEVEIGYRLVPILEPPGELGLKERISSVRQEIAHDLGLVLPGVHIRDSRRVRRAEYAILLRGNELGRWEIRPRGLLAVARRPGAQPLDGLPGFELDGRPTFWIEAEQEDLAIDEGYDLLSPAEAVAAHIDRTIRAHAPEILSREEVSRLVADLGRRAPGLVEDLIPRVVGLSELHRILQDLLGEGISVRDLETILETLGRHAGAGLPPGELVEAVRRALARTVCSPSVGRDGRLHVVLLEPALEEFLVNSLESVEGDQILVLDPQTRESICSHTRDAIVSLGSGRCRPAILCSRAIRAHFSRMVARRVPSLSVLSYDEVLDERSVEVHGSVTLDVPSTAPPAMEEVKSERWKRESLDSKPRQ